MQCERKYDFLKLVQTFFRHFFNDEIGLFYVKNLKYGNILEISFCKFNNTTVCIVCMHKNFKYLRA